MFKTVIGRGHPEFSTNRQQDAQEFFMHLLSSVDRAEVRFERSRFGTDYNLSGFCSCVGPVVQNFLTVVNPLLFLLATKNDLLLDFIYPLLRFYFLIGVSIACASVSKRK